MQRSTNISNHLILIALIYLSSCSRGPEDAFGIICENCTVDNGAALVGNCPQGYAKLIIKDGQLTVKYKVDCGGGTQSATESGKATDLKLVNSPSGNYIQGRWTDRGDLLADADLKLSFNENWEYHYGNQLKLALYNSSWEYQFNWTPSENTIDELCNLMYSEAELATIDKKRQQRILLDYKTAGELEILGFILNSKWRNNDGDAKIDFDSTTNTLSLNCITKYGKKTYSLGNLRFEEEFNQMMAYRNLSLFNKGFLVDYKVTDGGEAIVVGKTAQSKGLTLESSGGRLYFEDGGFFKNYGPQENILDDATLLQILEKLKKLKTPIKATTSNYDVSGVKADYFTVIDPDGFSNLRKVPGGAIIRQVYNGEKFKITGEEQNHKKVKFDDASTGYIHTSRVVNFNSKVCECLTAAKAMIDRDMDKDPKMKTGFSDGSNKSRSERFVEIFRFNQCPKGCDFLSDESIINFKAEMLRCL